ncbi:cytochrome P450 [Nocardioides hungaricus]
MSTQELQSFNPMVAPHRDDPNPFYAWARHEQPVCYAPALNAYVVTRYDDIKSVVADPETFSSANSIGSMWDNQPSEVLEELEALIPEAETLVNTDEPAHTPLRGIINHAVSGRRVRQQLNAMTQKSGDLVDALIARGSSAELVHDYVDPYVQHIISLLFGVPVEDVSKVQAWTDDHLLLLSPLAEGDKVQAARRLVEYQEYIDAMAADRQANPREDLMSDLVHGTNEFGPVRRDDLHFLFRGLRLAGHDTTMNLITSTLLAMLRDDRKLWEQVLADRTMLPMVIEETLRRDAPHRGLMRITTREATIAETTLPAGTALLLLFGSANRDETRFDEPDEFQLDRPNIGDHLAFGGGIHQCPGAQLARTEVRVSVSTLLDRLPDLRLADGYQPTYVASYFFRGLQRLDVSW